MKAHSWILAELFLSDMEEPLPHSDGREFTSRRPLENKVLRAASGRGRVHVRRDAIAHSAW
jgi:hypothetical protein